MIGTEGVNLQMSGLLPNVDRLKDVVRNADPGFNDIEFKDSFSDCTSLLVPSSMELSLGLLLTLVIYWFSMLASSRCG